MKTLPILQRALHLALLAIAAVFLALHFVHLRADFPNNSPWMDWSKYTDEGWYGDAAIRHFLLGHWYVPGDFNPAVALPVWPFVEACVFLVTGVSLVAARALTVMVFAAILVAGWVLVARRSGPNGEGKPAIAASVAVLLLAISPFCFVFTRIAIMEPLLVLLTLMSLLAAQQAGNDQAKLRTVLTLGILLPILVLTKTTALFLTPSIFWMLFASSGYRLRPFLRIAVPAAALGGAFWLVYFLAVVRPHFLIDYRYLFSANAYTGMTRENFVAVLAGTIRDGAWMGPVLYPLALVSVVVSLAFAVAASPRLAARPVIVSLVLWIGGYMAFLAYHNNLQPRYYLVVAVPLTLLLPAVFEDLILPRLRTTRGRALALGGAAVVIASIVIPDAVATVSFVRHPEYTLLQAADDIAAYIHNDQRSDPTHNPLILSISGSDISLMTGLPSICDDFGTSELTDRVKRYQPGWYIAWNQVEDDKLDAIAPQYQLERVAAFPAMDDPDRNLLILYKMVPATTPPEHPARKRAPIPRPLRTRVGQQPSTNQLEH